MSVHIFGIRHHGPGSARSLRRAFETLAPDIVLVEGPPDAEGVLALLAHQEMTPPVALLVYEPDKPQNAVYYPFAVYSPEWQAIKYGLEREIPVRFMDLPQTHRMAVVAEEENAASVPPEELPQHPLSEGETPLSKSETDTAEREEAEKAGEAEGISVAMRFDPMQWIAEAAGYEDGEAWWERFIEHRLDAADQFAGVQEMMTALRDAAPEETDKHERCREAWMRQTIRAAEKEGFQKIAVVCGAWHGPALEKRPPAKEDAELLKGLPKTKVAATWVPWTYGRLTSWSGYGAGITSPAWYEQVWRTPENVVPHWMTNAAKLLREEDLPASTASVIEGVRLAETLAAVRDHALPGLPELMEAVQAVFCFGSDLPMRLIHERLVVGEKLGRVPDSTPMLPIQQDLRKEQKRLRLQPEAAHKDYDFDLRNATDLERSELLHRLNLLGVRWGDVQDRRTSKGTFHELWRLQWQPEFEVSLIEANVFGNTVAIAAQGKVREVADKTTELSALTALVDDTLNANLPQSVDYLMTRLQTLAAVTSDVLLLMESLPALANVLRYGNVRQTDTASVGRVVENLVTRICIGLPPACAALNDEAAAKMYSLLVQTHQSIGLLQNESLTQTWQATLQLLADRETLHGLVAGRCCRILLDAGVFSPEETGRRVNLALSTANDATQAAAWVEGLLRDSGDVLLHTDVLLQIIDGWVADLKPETFVELLPLLRRTFATFQKPVRRQLGERLKAGSGANTVSALVVAELDTERAGRVIPVLARLLGVAAVKG